MTTERNVFERHLKIQSRNPHKHVNTHEHTVTPEQTHTICDRKHNSKFNFPKSWKKPTAKKIFLFCQLWWAWDFLCVVSFRFDLNHSNIFKTIRENMTWKSMQYLNVVCRCGLAVGTQIVSVLLSSLQQEFGSRIFGIYTPSIEHFLFEIVLLFFDCNLPNFFTRSLLDWFSSGF